MSKHQERLERLRRQAYFKIINYLLYCSDNDRKVPTQDDISVLMEVGRFSVQKRLNQMAHRGYITMKFNSSRSIEVTKEGLKFIREQGMR